MAEIDVNAVLLKALETTWPKEGDYWHVAARIVSKFDTSKVGLRLLNLTYPGMDDKIVHRPVILQQAQVRNPTAASVKHTVTYTRTYTDAYEWNVSAGVKLAASATFKAGIPLIGEGKATTSVELSFGAGYKNSHAETVTFQGSVEVQIPPQTSVQVKTILAQGKIDAMPFKATLQAYGLVGAYMTFGTEYAWAESDLDTGVGWYTPGFKNCPAFKDPSVRTFVVDGLFSADCGFNVNVVVEPLASLV